jgi:hypothetical protein
MNTKLLSFILAAALLPMYPLQVFAEQNLQPVEEQRVSTATVTAFVAESSGTASGYPGLATAIGDLNYKIELIQSRYIQLNNDIENLRSVDSAIRKMIAEDRMGRPDAKKFNGLEAQVELVRSDISQVREEMAVLRTGLDKNNKAQGSADWLRSPWITITALAFSIIAVLAR